MKDDPTSSERAGPEAMGREPAAVVFFGTPAFAVPTLAHLANDDRFDVRLVVTQPDRPAGRGRKLETSAVKVAAESMGLPVYQPDSLRTAALREPLVRAGADVFVVAAYGLIFGPKTLAIPRRGCVNVHASLLPAYRGASPVAAAILRGDPVAGVTLMLMEEGLDTGPMLAQVETAVEDDDTTASLSERLADLGASLTIARLPDYLTGTRQPTPQPRAGATLTRPLHKVDGWLNWSLPVADLERTVRAMWPWPRAWTLFDQEPLQIHAAGVAALPDEGAGQPAGTLIDLGGEPAVVCGDGVLVLRRLLPAGGKAMDGRSFLAGRRYALTQVLGEGGPPPAPPPLIVPSGGA